MYDNRTVEGDLPCYMSWNLRSIYLPIYLPTYIHTAMNSDFVTTILVGVLLTWDFPTPAEASGISFLVTRYYLYVFLSTCR